MKRVGTVPPWERALLTILDEPTDEVGDIPALVSEEALSDWERDEEEEAWSHLEERP